MNRNRRYNASTSFIDANLEAGRAAKTALICGEHEHSYADVAAMVSRAAGALRGLGVRMEERVMLLLLDSPEFVASFFGAIRIGAVPVPVNTLLRAPDYEYLLADSRAAVLLVSETLYPTIEPVLQTLGRGHLRQVVVVGEGLPALRGEVRGPPGTIAYEEWTRAEPHEIAPADTGPDDACFWLYSSGTTGFPKGAVHLQHDMSCCAESYARGVLGITEEDRTFSVAKLFFAYGLGNALYFPFYVGATTILHAGPPAPKTVYELVTRHRPTLLFSVPTSYAALLAVAEVEQQYSLASVRLAVSAGEALPSSIYERFKERWGVEILDGIGSTEVLHIFISNRPGRVRPGASGELVPGYQARVVDDEDRELPAGEVGNLVVRGDSTCAGYWNQHENTKRTINGEWIRTGDKYLRDDEGVFFYQGRCDDMLKAGGIWVSPVEVESTLVAHEGVLECAVVGQRDADELTKPLAFVVLKEGFSGTPELEQELKRFVKDRIAPYKYPRWIRFTTSLPKTATGKIQRYKLRELLRSEDAGGDRQ